MTVWALAVAGWWAGTMLLWRLPDLAGREASANMGAQARTVTVVVPARNEERSLPALLESLAAQATVLDVLVVNDASTDRTAEVARAGGARVLEPPPPPPGWLGKPWALQAGVAASSGELLVLLDADVTLARGALERLLAVHDAEAPDGLLSVQPHHVVERPYEHLALLPNAVPLMASGIARLGRRRAAPDVVAFGPCLVTTRAALDAVGGLSVAAGEIVDDIALARAYRAHRRPVRCCTGGSLVRFRMYPDGPRSLVQGFTKNLAAGAVAAPVVPAVGAALWVTTLVGSVGMIASAALEGRGLVAVGLWAAVAGQVRWVAGRVGTFRWWAAALYPVPVVAFVGLFAVALVHQVTGTPVVWRGRRIRPGRVVG